MQKLKLWIVAGVFGVIVCSAIASEPPAPGTLDDCICKAVAKLKPKKTAAGKVHLLGAGGSGATATEIENLGDEIRACLVAHNKTSYTKKICCVIDGVTYSIKVSAKTGGGNAASASGSEDIVIGVAGHGNPTTSQNGGQANATNSGKGATVAAGGDGGNNENNPGNGGDATALSGSGGSAYSTAGDATVGKGKGGLNPKGEGGTASSKSLNGCPNDADQRAAAAGGLGSDPAANEKRGGDGGDASVEINGATASGSGADGAAANPPTSTTGQHGAPGVAVGGQDAAGNTSTSATNGSAINNE